MALKRNQQIFLHQEAQEGVSDAIGTLVAAGTGAYIAIDPTIEFDPKKIKRNINRGTLTPAQDISGQVDATMSFGLEITGSGAGAVLSQLDLPLRACGFRGELLMKIPIGAITVASRFKHGEQVYISGTPATTIGIVVKDTYNGEPILYIAKQNGLGTTYAILSADIIVGRTTGATVTASADATASAGVGYWPVSYATSRLTVAALVEALAVGDTIKGATTGAIGVVDVAADVGATTIYFRPINGTWSAVENVARIAPTTGTAVAISAVAQLTCPTIGGAMTKDGVWEAASSMRGNATIRLPVGDLPVVQFEFKGSYLTHQDSPNVTGITFPQVAPAPFLKAGFKLATVGAASTAAFVQPCVASIEIQTGNELTQRQCANAAQGVYAYEITDRNPSATIDPELQPEAFYPVLGNFIGNTNSVMEVRVQPVLPADRDGRLFIIQLPNAGITSNKTGERSKRLVRNLTLSPNTGTSTNASVVHDNDIVIIHDWTVDGTSGV
jgi:hypothetical protein